MLNWLFTKRRGAGAPPDAPGAAAANRQAATAATSAQAAAGTASAKAPTRLPDRAEWDARLLAAQGDDATLLQLALSAPLWQIKLAAVQAIAGEDALKQAERALRHHDGRVHGAARQRLQVEAARRATSVKAQALIDAAAALAQEQPLPLNHLVALDRDWSALAAQHLTPAQASRFAERRGRLDELLRAQDEARSQALQRAAAELQALAEADARRIAERHDGVAGAEPAADRATDTESAASDAAEAAGDAAPVDAPDAASGDPSPDAAVARKAARRPAVGQPDAAQLAALDKLLQQAEAAAEAGQTSALQQRLQAIDAALGALAGAVLDGQRRHRCQALQAEWTRLKGWQRWGGSRARDELVDEAEALARLTLLALPALPQTAPSAAPAAAASAEPAPDDVAAPMLAPPVSAVTEVESDADADAEVDVAAEAGAGAGAKAETEGDADAGATTAVAASRACEPTAAPVPPAATDPAPARRQAAPKLALKSHGEAIQSLRKRWKELDRLGAVANQTLWRRFDAALHLAYQPVAAHLAALQAERQANLAAREALLDALDALAARGAALTPGVDGGDADDARTTPPDAPASPGDSGDGAPLKERLRALDRFHAAWRQLGPIEHTVPAQARSALQQRLQRSVERLEAPIEQARRAAEAAREALIQRAQALLPAARGEPSAQPAPPRDAGLRVRELQAEWQQQARVLPLARAVESALWARFKASTDAVFAQREAAFNARDAELAANLAAREALLQRLSALADDAPAAELQRALAEADRAWHEPLELPRAAVASVEARHRDLRTALAQRLSDAAQRQWQAQCDRLAARLALCEQREDAAAAAAADRAADAAADPADDCDDLARRWAALGDLPAAWTQALNARWAGAAAPGPLSEAAFDDLLLELEARLELPASPEQQAARRQLKLRALKQALEGRGAPNPVPAAAADALADAWRQGGVAPAQRLRLRRLVTALRNAAAGTTLAGAR